MASKILFGFHAVTVRLKTAPKSINEIHVEDKKGKEKIFINAEKDKHININSNRHESVGYDYHLTVGHDQFHGHQCPRCRTLLLPRRGAGITAFFY